jgi:hypothetical protein
VASHLIFANYQELARERKGNQYYVALVQHFMYLLSYVLDQKQSKDTQESLTKELIKYDCLTFCEKRLNSKFENEEDIIVFACFVSSFLSNGQFL